MGAVLAVRGCVFNDLKCGPAMAALKKCSTSPFVLVGSALGEHVGHVFFWSSSEQMIRANTGRVVAAMADVEIANWPVRGFISESWRRNCAAVNPELSVAVSVLSAHPQPTPVALFYVGPESFNRVGNLSQIAAALRAVLSNLRHVIRHGGSAVGAWLRDFLRPNSGSVLDVAGVRTETRYLASTTVSDRSAHDADALNFLFKVFSVHARQVYSRCC